MSLRVYYDDDIDASLKNKTIAIIGYGAQGRAHALNLRDSGCRVVIGQRAGTSHQRACDDGFEPQDIGEAAKHAEIICLMVPDEIHGTVFDESIVSALRPGDTVLCCHGFSLLYGLVKAPADINAVLVAPKGAGHMVRSAYEQGSGVPCYVALGENTPDESWTTALAYAKALGGGRVGIMKTTVREETETDLFGEQVVLCGGMSHLAVAAYETLIAAGYSPEMAYFECVHELKLVVDLLYRGGLAFMREHISSTAEYGDYTRGPRIVDDHVKQTMREILTEIQNGEFARQWIQESQSGGKQFAELRQQHRRSRISETEQRVHRILTGQRIE